MMRMIELIEKKRDGFAHSKEEIQFIIKGLTEGSIPDYQISAWLMAVYFQTMNEKEAFYLTEAMLESGEQMDLSSIHGIKVDKHSTGGVGDKTTLALAPLVATMGGKMAKLSGRGLGHTGGTIDKLESIPGFNTSLSPEAFKSQVNTIGCAVAGQTADVAPADKVLYALRDVTGTVPSIPLIASSIMAKKLASGADVIVLDVKVGEGAFMKTEVEATQLASLMVDIGAQYGKSVTAFLTRMDEPLGQAIGNRLEVLEAMDALQGQGPADFHDLLVELAGAITTQAKLYPNFEAAKAAAEAVLSSGEAFARFEQLVEAQGGNLSAFNAVKGLTPILIRAPKAGTIQSIHALNLGLFAMHLGAGRATKDDVIDPLVGLKVLKRVGETVESGEPIAEVYAQGPVDTDALMASIRIENTPQKTPNLILKKIGL